MTPHMEAVLRSVLVDSGCWEWIGARSSRGYGVAEASLDGRRSRKRAHRVTYEHFVGPIPEGLTLDHLCKNKGCVRPLHLEPVTAAENTMRKYIPGYRGSGTCIRGHSVALYRRYRPNGITKDCRKCEGRA